MKTETQEKFFILDGNAILHRAWHALPALATRDGRVVNAVYGFLLILLKLLRDENPTHLAVTFDKAGPTFRHEAYGAYKAQREKAPDELYAQIPILQEVLQAMGIPIYEETGYEADDLIGTIATNTGKKGIQTFIATGDLDTLQLVSPNIKIYTFARGISDAKIYDKAAVLERYGLLPEQMIDYKALRGDPSDNIKGVKGIGEKTATELIQKFGSVPNLYKEIKKKTSKSEEIREKVRNTLIEGEEDAKLSLELVKIRLDAPIEFSFKDTKLKEFDREKIEKIFQDLGFKTLIEKLPGSGSDIKIKKDTKKDYRLIKSKEDMGWFLDEVAGKGVVSLRIFPHSTDIFDRNILGIAISWQAGNAAFLPYKFLKELSSILADKKIIKVGHDLKNDFHLLKNIDLELDGEFDDLMIISYLLSPGSRAHDLSNLLFENFGVKTKEVGKQQTLLPPRIEDIYLDICEEVDLILELRQKFLDELEKRNQTKLFKEIEAPSISILASMERCGVKIDTPYLESMAKNFHKRIDDLTKEIYKMAGEEFNINSPAQLKVILFDRLKIPAKVRKTPGGELSTAAGELERLRGSHPIIDLIFEYRELSKLISTYVDALPKLVRSDTGRVHTTYNQTVTSTGRLSSSEPNLQNIPIRTEIGREIRKAFIAEKGYKLVAADYSQVELRMAAVVANVKGMIAAFRSGVDIHVETAAKIWNIAPSDVTKEQRRAAKAINFGIVYGIGPRSLAESAGISFGEAQEFIQRYFDLYPELQEYLDQTKTKAAVEGFVETLFGRRRYLPEIASGMPQVRASAERMAINAPVQGSAADLMKLAMIEAYKMIGREYGFGKDAGVKMILQVHDELIFEVKETLVNDFGKKIKDVMEHVHEFVVPFVVDVESGRSWGELTKIEF